MMVKTDVCIVGSGPGGALLAYLLAKQNISVLLLERNGGVAQEFRGEFLNGEGEGILKKLGLFEKVEELGLLRMEKIEYWQDGQIIREILPDAHTDNLGIHVPQNHLLKVIIDDAKKMDAFSLMLNTRMTDLIRDDSGQFCGVKALKDGREMKIQSPVIIGADGRFSTVRRKAEIPVAVRNHGYDVLWAKIPAPSGWKPTIKHALVDSSQMTLFTQAGGFIQIGWNIEHGAYPALRKQPFEHFLKKLTLNFPELAGLVEEHIQSWQDFIVLDVHSSQCETWTKNGVMLMGDAAHTMTPTGAFGLNCALGDAELLASQIHEHVVCGDPGLDDLKRAELKRRATIEKLQALQVEMEESFASKFATYV